ncbi:MAG: hypothetical protein FK732_09920, partial [Asgard group archaeon]|nr:hypothetical protein [Asgard group archaeon]
MLKKTRTKRPSFFLIVIMILLSCIILENVTAKLPVELYYGESFTWVINDISEGNNQWYNVSDFLSFENWHANQSNVVSFTVYSSEEINNKEYLTGNLEIGNLTVETHDQEIAFNLILSAFTWYGGLVSLEENWDDLIYTTPFNGSSTQVTYDVLTNILDREVDAIRINYDEFGQVTELLY